MKAEMPTKIAKTITGIEGLDEITGGGFPAGKSILICGSPGCGKTLFAMQFLIKGITEANEPGVFMSFEEGTDELIENVKSVGLDAQHFIDSGKLKIDQVRVERSEIEETGEYDLEGLFIRLNHAIESIGAKRVVLDTIETLFGGMENQAVLRAEIRRLFQWLKSKGVTAVITGEYGQQPYLTRQGLEEYISDCVILLDFRVIEQIATRRLRIIKYRGSNHGTNEYPFLIDENGISVMPITSLKLNHKSSDKRISTGLPYLDGLFSGNGIFVGSSVLITGAAGTAKTIFASLFAKSCCERKERVIYFSLEESPNQLIRNMRSVNIDLKPYVDEQFLHIYATRPYLQGLERHLLVLNKLIRDLNPCAVIVDPISSLINIGSSNEVQAMLVRLIDTLKQNQISSLFTSLTHGPFDDGDDVSIGAVSSLADTWINLQNQIINSSSRKRTLLIVKSRGMGHANEKQEFAITTHGIKFETFTG